MTVPDRMSSSGGKPFNGTGSPFPQRRRSLCHRSDPIPHRYIVSITCRAAVEVDSEESARAIADEIALAMAEDPPDHLIFETEVTSVVLDPEKESAA